ncbi:translocation/assembly module TamB domain-containing protein [Novosphingobium album (ex Liu et al. 2023)]|uniref:Translocation/assembly module TamB domain-containing protein n=1 Tax=Novosphingobium album (ex Liu et al. 2023) TaxID=3031130 RepID=A0ABT5WUN1_9SPHN|nr:translocation/assembly module TamB domain-containing protein [Novosphingobium album (ex Liu et al. 2023)]MDE8653610.1 translocation/assembly module TamB domain-containing protein [Novosphingobium album (ex Liu et al. 2023)]
MAGDEPEAMAPETPAVPEAEGEAPARRGGWGVRLAKTAVAIVLGLVALVIAVIFGIDTGPGHRFVADQIAALEFENGMKIGVGRIEGSLYGAMTLHDLSIRDPRGEFLFAPEVHVDWRPFAYLSNHVDVRSATAGRMILRRVPQFRPTPPSDAPLLPDLDIDIGRLKVTRFIAEPPVSGERRIATIDGKAHIADGRAQIEASGGAIAARGLAGGDRFRVKLDAVPDRNRLDIDLDLNAPRGGLIAALAGLDQPLAMKVSGKGDWAAWNGQLAADLGGGEFARLALSARDGTFAIKGPTRIARLFTGPTASLLGPVTQLDLTAALADRRATLSGQVASDAFTLTPQGVVDLSDNSFADLKLAFVLLKPSALAENLSGAGLRALLTLDGAFVTPRVRYAINANRIVMNDMGLEQFSATGAARVDADKIMIPVTARAARITGLDTVAGGALANVRLDGDLAIDGPRVLSDNMRIRSDRIDARVILLADMSKGLYTGAINGRIDAYRLESVGILNIETDVDLKSEARGFALEGTVKARSTRLINESLRTYLGGNFAASSRVRYGSDGMVRFSALRLEAPDLRILGGQGSYAPDGRITLAADGTSRRYGRIGVRVAGTIADPNAHVTAERPDLGIGLANLDARIDGVRGGYRLDLTGDTDYGPLKADVTLGMGKALSLQINSGNLSGVDFAGHLTQTAAGPFTGELTANGNGMGGLVRLGAEGRYQTADFNIRARGTAFAGPANLTIGSAIIDGRAVLYDQPLVIADAQLAGSHYGSFDIAAARVLIDYRNGRGHAKGLIEGSSGVPFRMSLNADLQPQLWRVALAGRVRGLDVKTLSPARIVPKDGTYELLPTSITFGGGNVRLAGRFGAGMKLQSRLENVDMALVNAFMPGLGLGGSASGSLDFEQADAAAFPRADARLHLGNFTRTTATLVSQPVDVNFVGKLLPDGGEARAVIRRRGTVIGRLVASLRPLPPGSGPWRERLMSAPLGGGIRYNGPADTLFSFAGQPDQRLGGPVGLAADFSCRVADPCLAGVVRGKGMTYENLTYGTKLTAMDVSGRFDGNRLELERLTANAGSGTITASGSVSLAAEAGYPMDVAVTLEKARLARGEALSASATGQLRLTKRVGETALLSGRLRLPETRYQIVREGAAQVPQLTGVRFKPATGPQRVTGDEVARPLPGAFSLIRLDIELVAPEKLYVSGMGLESEWRADFTVKGTSTAPVLAGEVELVRGTLGFAGRSFELTEGQIGFTGGATIDPTVRLVATEDVEDVTVNVNVGGRATNPEITFSSVPGLPQDEILSRILFGNSIANLSAIQAVQLAASLNSLRATGGGLNPLGKLRSATGIDRLRILSPDEQAGRGTALAAGQYITDDIYVELITDTRGFTATQLEVAITKWLSVLSQAGGSGVNSVNVRIKKNY